MSLFVVMYIIRPALRALYRLFGGGDGVTDAMVTVKEDCEPLELTDEQLVGVMEGLDKAIRDGLGRETNAAAVVKCYVTYVQDLPDRTERGRFLALDLGGTNFRVLLIELGDNGHFHMDSEIFRVPAHVQTGEGAALFDHIAGCLARFVHARGLDAARPLPLGFTFSFPLRQAGLTRGYLSGWTKGFDCSGVVDEDVVALLVDAIGRRGDVAIDVCAILNDTTGTLMSCAWKNPDTRIGLIVGTGCNACYVERVENVETLDGAGVDAAGGGKPYVIVNTEWGAFGDGGELDAVRTAYDRDVDARSVNPGRQRYEKMISGLYMGELVRLAVVDLARRGKLFGGRVPGRLAVPGAFETRYVSDVEADADGGGLAATARVLADELGVDGATPADCANVRHVCRCVSTRSAHLVAAGLAVLLNRTAAAEPAADRDGRPVAIGVDGSVYRFHPHFHARMDAMIRRLAGPDVAFDLTLSEDGSGRGAALVAAVASRHLQTPARDHP